MRLVKWELKARKQLDLGLERETLGNRGGPEVEEWRAKIEGPVRAEASMGTGNGRMECQYGRRKIRQMLRMGPEGRVKGRRKARGGLEDQRWENQRGGKGGHHPTSHT